MVATRLHSHTTHTITTVGRHRQQGSHHRIPTLRSGSMMPTISSRATLHRPVRDMARRTQIIRHLLAAQRVIRRRQLGIHRLAPSILLRVLVLIRRQAAIHHLLGTHHLILMAVIRHQAVPLAILQRRITRRTTRIMALPRRLAMEHLLGILRQVMGCLRILAMVMVRLRQVITQGVDHHPEETEIGAGVDRHRGVITIGEVEKETAGTETEAERVARTRRLLRLMTPRAG